MANFSGMVEGISGITADTSFVIAVSCGIGGVLCALVGVRKVSMQASKLDALYCLFASLALLVASWKSYETYKATTILANGIKTGPIYEMAAVFVLMCLPMALVLSLLFSALRK